MAVLISSLHVLCVRARRIHVKALMFAIDIGRDSCQMVDQAAEGSSSE